MRNIKNIFTNKNLLKLVPIIFFIIGFILLLVLKSTTNLTNIGLIIIFVSFELIGLMSFYFIDKRFKKSEINDNDHKAFFQSILVNLNTNHSFEA